ncbi:hypothetical protein DK058_24630 [Salmonella enterica subsp. enterica serovar Typhi]|nr:hypothetical protein [Salmonella enterica subsp. enterica serovar Typhi]
MVSKARKSNFLADFIQEPRYFKPLMELMKLERGTFYPLYEQFNIIEFPASHLMLAWLIQSGDDEFRSIICFDPKDFWTGYAFINYPSYLERAETGLNWIH